jgi:hypothetical protein
MPIFLRMRAKSSADRCTRISACVTLSPSPSFRIYLIAFRDSGWVPRAYRFSQRLDLCGRPRESRVCPLFPEAPRSFCSATILHLTCAMFGNEDNSQRAD